MEKHARMHGSCFENGTVHSNVWYRKLIFCYCKWIWLRVPMPAIKGIYSMSERVPIVKLWNPPGKESIVKAAKKSEKIKFASAPKHVALNIFEISKIILDRFLFNWSSRTDFDPPKKQSLLKRCHFFRDFLGTLTPCTPTPADLFMGI